MRNTPFAPPKPSMERIEDRTFVAVSTLGVPEEDGRIYLDAASCAYIALGGIDQPADNGNEYYRFDVTKKDKLSSANRGLSQCTAGVTARFITDAATVVIDAKLRNAITGMNHFCNRGVYGFDMLIGTGTDRRYSGGIMQMFVGTPDAMKQCTEGQASNYWRLKCI